MELTELLAGSGYNVIPFSARSERNEPCEYSSFFPEAVDFNNPRIREIPAYVYNFDAEKKISKLIRQESISIAHFHIYYGKITGSVIKPLKEAGIPLVQSLHEYKLACPVYTMISDGEICNSCRGQHFYRALPKRCNRNSMGRTLLSVVESYVSKYLGNVDKFDHFIGVSQFMTDQMIDIGVSRSKISTIHNYVDTEKLTPLNNPERAYFLYFGRIERLKGIYTLAKAMQLNPEARLVIAGTGDGLASYESWLIQHGISNIELVGFKSGGELRKLIQNARATIIPSEWYENCPLSVLESFAYGVPVIGARVGGIPELISHGQNGFLFEMGDADELARQLAELEENDEICRIFAENARKDAEQRFSKQEHINKITDLYNQLM